MDRISKVIRKLDRKHCLAVEAAMPNILRNDFRGLDVKKLTGFRSRYRVRIGDVRIIFIRKRDDISIIAVDRRNESTYQ